MPDMLAAGASWMLNQLHASASQTVTYVRGSDAVEVTATIGSSRFESQNSSGVIEQWESRDYLVKAADLPFGFPVRGDLIVEANNGDPITYEVSSPRGVPEWHYGDAYRYVVRIHTTQITGDAVFIVTEDGDLLTA